MLFITKLVLLNFILWQLGNGAAYDDGTKYAPYNDGHAKVQGLNNSAASSRLCVTSQGFQCREATALTTIITTLGPTDTKLLSSLTCPPISPAAIDCVCTAYQVCFINKIKLPSSRLTGYIHSAISTLPSLSVLDLSNNQLFGSIPQSLGSLTNLTVLNLSGNKLTGFIPDTLTKLQNLEWINLGSNDLDGPIPSSLGNLRSLEFLDLSWNRLKGHIPDSLGNCQSLSYVDLSSNFLNGNIPLSLGDLSSLTNLDLWSNSLSGEIPNELGGLSKLEILRLDDNDLSGELPHGLGNLHNIRHLWLTSNHFTGIISENYHQLTNLEVFAVAGNYLSGRIPKYIETWHNLSLLILHGNDFEGYLPEGIFKLSKLQNLWVSDLKPGFSFPNRDNVILKRISSLILRNCSIRGPIPAYIGEWPTLNYLDLSFNELTGEIPESLKNLETLILTRNKLDSPPPWLSRSDTVHPQTDLSYNNIGNASGASKNVKIYPNRNYTSDLKKSKQCHQKYKSLRINCGGEAVPEQNYDRDNSTSDYYENEKWAYSFSGHYAVERANTSTFIKNLTCGVSVPEGELYNSVRLAPVSLIYYGFCLHKGKYNVKLHFAETIFANEEDHSIVGKRVFDVYIQKMQVLKDFNIKEKAGDSKKRLVENFKDIPVRDGTLEIHLFWAGKGSLYNPPALNGPLISAISVTRVPRKLSALEIVLITIASIVALLILLAIMWKMGWIGDKELRETQIEVGERSVSLKQIIDATRKFSPKMEIGRGRFGIVYKAELPDQIRLAVKKISPQLKQQRKDELQSEIYNLKSLQHENLVQLLDIYSNKGLHLLIYEYMEKGSLHHALFEPNSGENLDWKARSDICLGMAKGLKYLHEEKRFKIVHGNIKASNIMLDKTHTAKLSDFGLAMLYDEDDPFMTIKSKPSRVYMAPEYSMGKAITVKADVYSFGIVLLEIMSGKPSAEYAPNQEANFLLDTAFLLYEKKRILDLVDKKLSSCCDWKQATIVLHLAIKCLNPSPSLRPGMSEIVGVLSGEISIEQISKV